MCTYIYIYIYMSINILPRAHRAAPPLPRRAAPCRILPRPALEYPDTARYHTAWHTMFSHTSPQCGKLHFPRSRLAAHLAALGLANTHRSLFAIADVPWRWGAGRLGAARAWDPCLLWRGRFRRPARELAVRIMELCVRQDFGIILPVASNSLFVHPWQKHTMLVSPEHVTEHHYGCHRGAYAKSGQYTFEHTPAAPRSLGPVRKRAPFRALYTSPQSERHCMDAPQTPALAGSPRLPNGSPCCAALQLSVCVYMYINLPPLIINPP